MHLSERLAKAVEKIKAADWDAMLLGPSPDLEYLLGLSVHRCERFNGLFLLPGGDVFAVVSRLYLEEFKRAMPDGAPVYDWPDEEWFYGALEQAFEDFGLDKGSRLGVNDGISAVDAVEIAKRCGTILENGWRLLEDLRIIKSPGEQQKLKRAGEIADRTLEALLPFIEPGKTEKQIKRKLLEILDDMGASDVSFQPIVARGENAAMPHYPGGDGVIGEKDSLLIDFGCRFEGYCSDMTRTLFIGEPDEDVKEMYEVVLHAQEEGERAVQPGVAAEDIDIAARRVIEEAGYGGYFNNRLGHGIGIAIHEAPNIIRGNRMALAEGMAFSVEPGIYIPGKIGIRIENCVVVTDDGCEALTRFPKEIIILE